MVHQERTDGKYSDDRKGSEALKGIITDGCAFFDDVRMTIEVDPIVEKSYVSARWKARGTLLIRSTKLFLPTVKNISRFIHCSTSIMV